MTLPDSLRDELSHYTVNSSQEEGRGWVNSRIYDEIVLHFKPRTEKRGGLAAFFFGPERTVERAPQRMRFYWLEHDFDGGMSTRYTRNPEFRTALTAVERLFA